MLYICNHDDTDTSIYQLYNRKDITILNVDKNTLLTDASLLYLPNLIKLNCGYNTNFTQDGIICNAPNLEALHSGGILIPDKRILCTKLSKLKSWSVGYTTDTNRWVDNEPQIKYWRQTTSYIEK